MAPARDGSGQDIYGEDRCEDARDGTAHAGHLWTDSSGHRLRCPGAQPDIDWTRMGDSLRTVQAAFQSLADSLGTAADNLSRLSSGWDVPCWQVSRRTVHGPHQWDKWRPVSQGRGVTNMQVVSVRCPGYTEPVLSCPCPDTDRHLGHDWTDEYGQRVSCPGVPDGTAVPCWRVDKGEGHGGHEWHQEGQVRRCPGT